MNISPTDKGLEINESKDGWFNKNYINFKYRLKNRNFYLIGFILFQGRLL